MLGKLVVHGFNSTAKAGGLRLGDPLALEERTDRGLEVCDIFRVRGMLEIVNGPSIQETAIRVDQVTPWRLLRMPLAGHLAGLIQQDGKTQKTLANCAPHLGRSLSAARSNRQEPKPRVR